MGDCFLALRFLGECNDADEGSEGGIAEGGLNWGTIHIYHWAVLSQIEFESLHSRARQMHHVYCPEYLRRRSMAYLGRSTEIVTC